MRGCVLLLFALLLLSGWLILGADAAGASNRFGTPWQSRIIVDQATLYERADPSARTVGTLNRGAIVVVTAESTDPSGHEWTQTPGGFVPSEDVAEDLDAWVADVTVASTPVYARPNAHDAVRMSAKKGQLLRVTGVSPGLNGDNNVW